MFIHQYFLIVPILLPLFGGALMFLLKLERESMRRIYVESIMLLTSLILWLLLLYGRREPVTIYSFSHGFSITFAIDGLGSLFAGMVSLMWPLVTIYAFEYMHHAQRKNVFFAFYTMTYGITLGVALAADMITMYVFFEMLTLVTIPLVTHYGNNDSMYAGRKYAAYTIGGAALSFFAVVLTTVYGNMGTFTYGGCLNGSGDPVILRIAFLFAFFGFGPKAAVFPMYDWLPTAGVAPTPVTALLHAVAVVNAGVFAVIRLTWYAFGAEFLAGTKIQTFCILVVSFSLVFGAVMALKERHFKRRLAFSTMSNLSYMLLGVILLTPEGLTGGMAHMLFHGIIKMTLFLCAGAFMHQTGRSYIYEIDGIGKRMPVTFTCYTLGALSLTGIPMFCGFASKWTLLLAGLHAQTPAAMLGVCALFLAAFLCAMYTLTISIRAFFPAFSPDSKPVLTGEKTNEEVTEANWMMLFPIICFSVINIVFGVYSGPVMSFLEKIATGLI